MDQLIQLPDEVRRRRFKRPYPLFNSIGRILGGGQTFPCLNFPCLIVKQNKISKRATYITAQPVLLITHIFLPTLQQAPN